MRRYLANKQEIIIMSKFNRWLLVLLAAQLIITAVIYVLKGSSEANFKSISLLSFDKSQLTKLVITNGEKELESDSNPEKPVSENDALLSVTLLKQGDDWVLPQLSNLPVNQIKIDLIIGKLMGLKSNWPIAKTQDSHTRFEVASKKYQKKIQLFNGEEEIGELFLGTSPGFKKVHVRKSGSNEIYSLELNSYDFSGEAKDWLNKSLIQVDEPTKISFNDFSLEKDGAHWTLSPQDLISKGKQLDNVKVEALVAKLANFNVLGVESKTDKISAEKHQSIKVTADKEYRLTFYNIESDYWITRNDFSSMFTISSADYEALIGLNVEKLLTEVKKTTDEPGSSQDN